MSIEIVPIESIPKKKSHGRGKSQRTLEILASLDRLVEGQAIKYDTGKSKDAHSLSTLFHKYSTGGKEKSCLGLKTTVRGTALYIWRDRDA